MWWSILPVHITNEKNWKRWLSTYSWGCTSCDSSSIGTFKAHINSFSVISSNCDKVAFSETQDPGVLVMIFVLIMTQLKVYNVILINLNPQIPMVSIILTMGMFCQQHWEQTLIIFEGMYLCLNYDTYKIARPCYKLVKELTAQLLWK